MESALTSLRKTVLRVCQESGEGHIPSAFSVLDILWVLYDQVMNIDPENPQRKDRDRFVMSKGHAAIGLYAVLAEKGFFSADELKTFAQVHSRLGGHPDKNKVPGVEASTGSLGHGFPLAVGMAMGGKLQGNDSKVFVLVGDGECNEGTIWESALLAAHHKLGNLYCIVDYNHSTDRALDMGDIEEKFRAFGWSHSQADGHNAASILSALSNGQSGKPHVVVANTIKGFGCGPLENNPEWHHKSPTIEELDALLREVR